VAIIENKHSEAPEIIQEKTTTVTATTTTSITTPTAISTATTHNGNNINNSNHHEVSNESSSPKLVERTPETPGRVIEVPKLETNVKVENSFKISENTAKSIKLPEISLKPVETGEQNGNESKLDSLEAAKIRKMSVNNDNRKEQMEQPQPQPQPQLQHQTQQQHKEDIPSPLLKPRTEEILVENHELETEKQKSALVENNGNSPTTSIATNNNLNAATSSNSNNNNHNPINATAPLINKKEEKTLPKPTPTKVAKSSSSFGKFFDEVVDKINDFVVEQKNDLEKKARPLPPVPPNLGNVGVTPMVKGHN